MDYILTNNKSNSVNRRMFTRTIWPNFILIQFETTELFWRGHTNNNKNSKNKISSDTRSVSDPNTDITDMQDNKYHRKKPFLGQKLQQEMYYTASNA